MQQRARRTKEVHDEQSGTYRSHGLQGLIPECIWRLSEGGRAGVRVMGRSVLFSEAARVGGQLLRGSGGVVVGG